MNKPLIDLINETNKFYLGGKFSLNEIKATNIYNAFITDLLDFIKRYKQTNKTTLTADNFIISCLANGYKYENFALAFIQWSENQYRNEKDDTSEINANKIFDEYEKGGENER